MEGIRSWISGMLSWKWCPTSQAQLEDAEKRMLAPLTSAVTSQMVDIGDGCQIRSISINSSQLDTSSHIPLVLVHGFGGGVGIWIKNLDELSRHRSVYAFDVLGFGRSSRPKFSDCPVKAEDQLVESIEKWRAELGLEKFVLLGHSLGAYLASAYAIKFPERVEHVVLAEPWGFPEQPLDAAERFARRVPMWVRMMVRVMEPFNPLAGIRAAGPWGPNLIVRFRSDIQAKYDTVFGDDTVVNYIYHCNAQTPSGESAFKAMTKSFGWARHPMIQRIHELDHSIPITMIYGSRTWMDISVSDKVKELRPYSYVDVKQIDKAGHHIYSDKSDEFNDIVIGICNNVHQDLHHSEQSGQ